MSDKCTLVAPSAADCSAVSSPSPLLQLASCRRHLSPCPAAASLALRAQRHLILKPSDAAVGVPSIYGLTGQGDSAAADTPSRRHHYCSALSDPPHPSSVVPCCDLPQSNLATSTRCRLHFRGGAAAPSSHQNEASVRGVRSLCCSSLVASTANCYRDFPCCIAVAHVAGAAPQEHF